MLKVFKKNYPIYSDYTINIRSIEHYKSNNFINSIKRRKYFTEIILITNNNHINDIIAWLTWHINIVKFDHVILIDNNNSNILEQCAIKFGDKVEYYHMQGNLSQSELYNKFVNNSMAQWVLPIDDDEFLYISNKFNNNINTYLKYLVNYKKCYKYSFNWHMMFSETLLNDRDDSPIVKSHVLTYISQMNRNLDCFNLFKTIVNTDLSHLYVSDNGIISKLTFSAPLNSETKYIMTPHNDVIGTVHNPVTLIDNNLVLTYNEESNQLYAGLFNNNVLDINANGYLLHYKYKTYTEWAKKCNDYSFVDISIEHVNKNYRLETFRNVYNFVRPNTIIDNKLLKTIGENI